MTIPFNDPFNTFYDQYSIKTDELSIPAWWNIFKPLNSDDFNCLSIISPSTQHGARKWTVNGSWLTIGIYRDEGREPAIKPSVTGLPWIRSGTTLVIFDPSNLVEVGQSITLYNLNTASLTTTVASTGPGAFSINVEDLGDLSGSNGAWQSSSMTNFFESNIVFRLFPSFKLIKWSEVQSYFSASTPLNTASRELLNITTGQTIKPPSARTAYTDYTLQTNKTDKPELLRFRQRFDEAGRPLKTNYNPAGFPIIQNKTYSIKQNSTVLFQNPIINEVLELIENPFIDTVPDVFDFYGLPINDISRGPYFVNDIISRNLTVLSDIDNITRKTNGISELFSGRLFDRFGNLVIGIQTDNGLVSQTPILPIPLDQFNHPFTDPIPREVK